MHTITARYSGDSNHASGVSAGVAQVVNGHTNQSISTQVLVSAPEGAAVYVDGALKATVGASGYSSFGVSTSAPDGEKSFAVQTRSGVTVLTSSTLKLWRDTVLPAWSGLAPPVSGYLRSGSTFDYTLSEAAASARITITRTGGAADATVHVCTLQGTALSSGSHQIGLDMGTNGCSTVLTLVNGAIYTLAFAATDAAGNASVATTVIGVTYDTSLPIFSSLVPAQDGALKADSLLEYTLSEAVASASITFTRTGGAADAGSPRVCALQGTALGTGVHQVPLGQDANGCMVALGLIDGAMYTLAYAAADAAGNASAATEVTGVMLDSTAPTASLAMPPYSTSREVVFNSFGGSDAGGSGIATAGYCVREVNAAAGCIWGVQTVNYTFASDGAKTLYAFVKDKAGNVSGSSSASVMVDTAVPVAPSLTITPAWATGASVGVEVNGEVGSQVWVNGVNTGQTIGATGKLNLVLDTSSLTEGQKQTYAITLRDTAGNISSALALELTRDGQAPAFSALVPAQDGALKADSLLEYTLSEAVASASITFTRTGGAADAGSPRVCALQGTALGTGVHQVPLGQDANGCMVALGLIDGAMYTLAYAAADAAGNASAATEVTGVMYDVTAPAAPVVTSPLTVSGVGGTLTVSGTAEAGSRVFLVEGVVVLGSTSISGGAFSVALSGLADGLHNFSLTAQDAAGNVSAPALMGYTVLVQPPPAPQVVIEGAVSVPSGGAVTVGGAVQVSAGPGSTIVLTPQAGGTTITISPVVAGSNMPVTVVVGGQTLQFLADASSAMTLSVVTLVGADGRLQVALVLNPIKTSGSQVTVGGVVSDGTVIALLATSGGNIPMTTIGSGPVRLVMEATPQGSGAPNAWGIYVSQGRISVPVSANTTVGSVNGSGSIEVYPGEVALIGAAGQLNGIRLGTATGGGVGDPVPQTSLPASFHVGRGYARLTGTLDRLGGTRTLDDLVSSQVQEFGFATGGKTSMAACHGHLVALFIMLYLLTSRYFPGALMA